MTASKMIVKTFADGYGRWNAKVILPYQGYGPHSLDKHFSNIRRKAREAIRKEILSRENGPIAPVRVEVVNSNLDHMNVMHSITFREKD